MTRVRPVARALRVGFVYKQGFPSLKGCHKKGVSVKSFLDIARAITMVAFVGVLLVSSYGVFALGRSDLYSENGQLESIQAAVLAMACVIFLLPVVFEQRSDKLILLFFAWLCYAFVLRELNVEDFERIPESIRFFGFGKGRNMTLAAALILILAVAALNLSSHVKQAIGFLKSKPGALVLTAGALLFLAEFFEKGTSFPHHVYLEEIIELLAYVLLLLAAISVQSMAGKHRKTLTPDLSPGPDSGRACARVPPPTSPPSS